MSSMPSCCLKTFLILFLDLLSWFQRVPPVLYWMDVKKKRQAQAPHCWQDRSRPTKKTRSWEQRLGSNRFWTNAASKAHSQWSLDSKANRPTSNTCLRWSWFVQGKRNNLLEPIRYSNINLHGIKNQCNYDKTRISQSFVTQSFIKNIVIMKLPRRTPGKLTSSAKTNNRIHRHSLPEWLGSVAPRC